MSTKFTLLCLVFVLVLPTAMAAQSAGTTTTAKKTTIKSQQMSAVPQFTVRVPVRLVKIGTTWKRGAVQCDYKSIKDVTMPNPLQPSDPAQTMNLEMGHGNAAKTFALNGGGNYNATVSVGWSWSGDQITARDYRQTYRCTLMVNNSNAGDSGWIEASSAGIDVDSGSAYRVIVEGEIK